MSAKKTLAILVGGGPAPGINAVLAAATIEARNHGLRVLGCYDGFKWLVQGDTQHVVDLEINDTSRIHFDGGSIIRTSRTNPSKSAEAIRQVGEALQRLGVNHLITIGGDDTAYSASRLAKTVPSDQQVVPRRMTSVPTKLPCRSRPISITAAPTPPRAIAPHSMRRGHWPKAPDHSAVASGMTLMSATVAPELTQRSATATPPFPTTSMRNPRRAAPRHCLAVGMGWPRSACQATNTPPATRKRVPIRKKGGVPSMPTLMAKYVVPQMT